MFANQLNRNRAPSIGGVREREDRAKMLNKEGEEIGKGEMNGGSVTVNHDGNPSCAASVPYSQLPYSAHSLIKQTPRHYFESGYISRVS